MCSELTPYAFTRYPEDIDISESDAVTALQRAETIYTFCLNLIPALAKD